MTAGRKSVFLKIAERAAKGGATLPIADVARLMQLVYEAGKLVDEAGKFEARVTPPTETGQEEHQG